MTVPVLAIPAPAPAPRDRRIRAVIDYEEWRRPDHVARVAIARQRRILAMFDVPKLRRRRVGR